MKNYDLIGKSLLLTLGAAGAAAEAARPPKLNAVKMRALIVFRA